MQFTDGIGQISKNLIDTIKVQLRIKQDIQAIQFRMGGAKGVLALHSQLPNNTIMLRKSQKKFDAFNYNSIQVLDFNKYRGGFLNR